MKIPKRMESTDRHECVLYQQMYIEWLKQRWLELRDRGHEVDPTFYQCMEQLKGGYVLPAK